MHMELLQRDLKLSDRDKLQEKVRAEVTVTNGIAALAESKCEELHIASFEPCVPLLGGVKPKPKRYQVTSKNYVEANLSQ